MNKGFWRRIIVLGYIAFVSLGPVFAQTLDENAILDVICKNIKSKNLSPNSFVVKTIFQDMRGFIWMGLEHSLIRYDGESFIEFNYHPEEHPGMLRNGPDIIRENSKGDIWIGSFTTGVAVLKNNETKF